MLVLSRKEGESLIIGDRIVVTIMHVDSKRVRVGIDAPREIGIRRDELPKKPTTTRGNESQSHGTDESPFFAECW